MDTKMKKTLKNAKKWLINEFYNNREKLIGEYLSEEENEHIIKIEDIYGVYIDVLYVDTIEKKAYDAYDFMAQIMATDLVYIQEKIFPKLEELNEIKIEIQD